MDSIKNVPEQEKDMSKRYLEIMQGVYSPPQKKDTVQEKQEQTDADKESSA